MEQYDVIIVGAGPAGLKCAEELGKTDLRVLLIDKEDRPGDKLCAGGITLKTLRVLPLPDSVIEHKITRASVYSTRQRAGTIASRPFLFTINRKELSTYQFSLLEKMGIKIVTGKKATAVENDRIVLKDGTEYGFRILVGADGYSSLVRKYLGLPVRKKLIGFQYTLAVPGVDPVLEVYLDARRFGSGYSWIFPHRESIAVGCCCDPCKADHRKFVVNFHEWLRQKGIDPGTSKLESYPISYDYRGFRFGNIFLVGEAAGFASGLTGEGIYQSLVSGREVARMILDPGYVSAPLNEVLDYNRTLHRVLLVVRGCGPLRGLLYESFLFLMNRKRVRSWINAKFS